MRKRGFTVEEAERVATELGIQWPDVLFNVEQLRKGLDVELEHGKIRAETNVTNDDPVLTGKIAWAHLLERPDYYELLELVESGAIKTQQGPDMTVNELADAVESYDRTVSFASTSQTASNRRMHMATATLTDKQLATLDEIAADYASPKLVSLLDPADVQALLAQGLIQEGTGKYGTKGVKITDAGRAFRKQRINQRSVAATNTEYSEGRAMSEHPKFIKVAGQMYQLEEAPEERVPQIIRVNGFEYERADEPEEEPSPEFIRVKGMLFRRDDSLREAAKKKGKGKAKKDDKKDKDNGKGKGKAKKDDKKAPPKKGKGKWSDLPKGWTKKSAKSFWNTIGGSVTDCKRKLKDAEEIDNTGAFCASLKDLMEGEGWRKGPRKKKSKKASAGTPQYVTYMGTRYELES